MYIFDCVPVSDHVSATQQWQRSISKVFKLKADHVLVSKLYKILIITRSNALLYTPCSLHCRTCGF